MKFLKKKLKNGITVVMEKRDLPVVSFSITNRFGGAYEESKIKGIAHFIEHMLFAGTEKRTHEDISREVEKRGGVLNAFTAHEATSYYFKLPSEHLLSGMDILVDILKNSKFNKEKFDKERKVILEEIKMYHDVPQRHVFEMIEQNMYEKPFGELIIGSKETVSALDRDFVYEYWKKKYNPKNYIVSVVGDGDFDKICSYLEEHFEGGGEEVKHIEIKRKNAESVEERPGIDQAHFIFGIHAPLPGTDEHYALEVLDAYLANGMSSRLFLEIREKRGLAYAIRGAINAEKNYSNYLIYVGTTKEALGEVKEIILKEFENIKNMTEKDLEEAKERITGLIKISSEESSSVMQDLAFSELVSSAEDYYKHEEKINAVTLDQVKKLAEIKEYSSATVAPK